MYQKIDQHSTVPPSYLTPLLFRHVVAVLPLLLLPGSGMLVVLSQVSDGAFVIQFLSLSVSQVVIGEKVFIISNLSLQVLQLLCLSFTQVLET